MSDDQHHEVITRNRKAYRLYDVEEKYEAGIALQGTEVKSLRDHRLQLTDAYATFQDDELYLVNAHIAKYPQANRENHRPERPRKLLMHRHELDRLRAKVEQEGYTLIPLSVYFKGSHAKVELGVCKGKKLEDRREDIKKKEHQREMERERARREKSGYDYD